jgi:EAL domain-containing protein (putative c-di-GMP-specific phosphodiesterase class I)/CheY-like chemotaxis protein
MIAAEASLVNSSRMKVPTCNEVLVVEDDPAVQALYVRILERAGYQVAVANDGSAAAHLLVDHTFCAVVSDVAMPGMSGIELLRCVRVHDLDVPVILVTGAADVKTAVDAVSHGAFQLLMKPIAPALLIGEVKRAARLQALDASRRQAMRLLAAEEAEEAEAELLRSDFAKALGSIWMAFQPVVRRDGTLAGHEALLRSGEPSLPSPLAVISLAERLGAIHQLGRVVRQRAAVSFLDAPPDSLLFVNLHAHDLLDSDLFRPTNLLTQLAERVVLEITERASLDDIQELATRVADLRKLGFRIAIDDLGAGYAGLSSFALLEPEFAKIDMSLVRDVDRNKMKRGLIRLLVSTCKEMNITVVAEGIERVEERDTLLELGCELFQGYLLARPGPPFPSFVW